MPPRLPASCSAQLSNCFDNALIATHRTATAAGWPSWPPSRSPSLRTAPPSSAARFSTTTPLDMTRPQKMFRRWLKSEGKRLKYIKPHDAPGPAYVDALGSKKPGDASQKRQPFVNNPEFVAQPVLSAEAREIIWNDVMIQGFPLKAVAVRRNVDLTRVAAVIRMMSIEKTLEREGKTDQLAAKYCDAMMRMLPVHHLMPTDAPFETINDVEVHPRTQQQLFVPTSESRRFTRVDAAEAFGNKIVPPDRKIRIPELIHLEKRLNAGAEDTEARTEFVHKVARSEMDTAALAESREQREEHKKVRVDTDRFEFRFENVNANAVGKKGRSRVAAGWRYGVPHDDRKRGAVKIPTRVV